MSEGGRVEDLLTPPERRHKLQDDVRETLEVKGDTERAHEIVLERPEDVEQLDFDYAASKDILNERLVVGDRIYRISDPAYTGSESDPMYLFVNEEAPRVSYYIERSPDLDL